MFYVEWHIGLINEWPGFLIKNPIFYAHCRSLSTFILDIYKDLIYFEINVGRKSNMVNEFCL